GTSILSGTESNPPNRLRGVRRRGVEPDPRARRRLDHGIHQGLEYPRLRWIESDAAANHHYVDSSRAECRAGRRACRLRAPAGIDQQPFEVMPHRPGALLISLDPARNDVRVEWLAAKELAVEVDRIGIQPDPEDSLAPHLPLLLRFGIGGTHTPYFFEL